jgi:hypothetical protein
LMFVTADRYLGTSPILVAWGLAASPTSTSKF